MQNTPLKDKLAGIQLFWNDIDISEVQPDWCNVPIINNNDFLTLMSISSRTAIRWRMAGKIRYIQVGHKIYYTIKEVERFLARYEKHKKQYIRGN